MPTGNGRNAADNRGTNRATALRFEGGRMIMHLRDGRELSAPLVLYPTLEKATSRQRAAWELIGNGRAFHWPELDLDLSVDGILHGLAERIPPPPAVRGHKAAARQMASPIRTRSG